MKERQRIDTYDYMKCIAIIIVVVGHLYNVSYDAEILGSSTRSLVCVFINVSEMPLFFFLCGLFAKPQSKMKDIGLKLLDKARQLLLPFISCSILATLLIRHSDITHKIQDQHKFGYWFLESLFEFYILFYAFSYLVRKVTRPIFRVSAYAILVVMAYLIAKVAIYIDFTYANYINAYALKEFFIFFIFGQLFMTYQETISKFIASYHSALFAFSIVLISCVLTINKTGEVNLLISNWLMGISVVHVIYSLVVAYKETFPEVIQKAMLYIGRHTLDIYVLHFFFLPRNQSWISSLLGIENGISHNILFELFGGVALALIIISGCLILSSIIRLSKLLSVVFLGDKIK